MSTQIAAITHQPGRAPGLVIWVVAGRLQERARLRMELQVRMLERFASPAELKDFLESEGGRRLLGALSPRQTVAPRMLLAVQAGAVITILGIGLQMTGNRELLDAGIVDRGPRAGPDRLHRPGVVPRPHLGPPAPAGEHGER